MAYVWLTDYVVNSAGLVYQKAGRLSKNITSADVSKPSELFHSVKVRMCMIAEFRQGLYSRVNVRRVMILRLVVLFAALDNRVFS